jgi:hypothetical protein
VFANPDETNKRQRLDVDTHERLVRLFSDPSRRAHVVGRKRHLLSGIARCGKCGGAPYP